MDDARGRQVGEDAGVVDAEVGVEAHGVDGGDGRRKPDHIDRKTKKETSIKATGKREKIRIKGWGGETL